MTRLFNRRRVMDGAMGTRLMAAGHDPTRPLERLLLHSPNEVVAVHRSYVEAGAEVLLTHTFRASRPSLRCWGMEGDFAAIQESAVRAAREAAGGADILVLGALGPIERQFPDPQRIDAYREQALALMGAGADGILAETIPNLKTARAVLGGIAGLKLPFFGILFSLGAFSMTTQGERPHRIVEWVRESEIRAFGFNCGYGFSSIAKIMVGLVPLKGEILIARPSAGIPVRTPAGPRYLERPEAIIRPVKAMVLEGVTWIGGCCGTTPEEIRIIAELMHQ